MIAYRRSPLPVPLKALAWRSESRLVVVVGKNLSSKDARSAALAAIRRLPRGQQTWVTRAVPVGWLMLWLLEGGQVPALLLATTTAGTAVGASQAATEGLIGTVELPIPSITVPDILRFDPAPAPPAAVPPPHPADPRPPTPTASVVVSATPRVPATSPPPSLAAPLPLPPPTPSETPLPTPEPTATPEPTPTPTPEPVPVPSLTPADVVAGETPAAAVP